MWVIESFAERLQSPQIVRHSFASRALTLGEALPVIGELLGQSDIETAPRYAHLARYSVHDATERIEAARAGARTSSG